MVFFSFVINYLTDNKRFLVIWQPVQSAEMTVISHPRSEAERALVAMDSGEKIDSTHSPSLV